MPHTAFDTHFHLDADSDPAAVVDAAAMAGVGRMLAAGAPVGETARLLRQIAPYPEIAAAVGVHPHEAAQFDGDLAPYRRAGGRERVCAVGEIGLDFHYDHSPRDCQQAVFRQFLRLAVELGLPAIVHVREAEDEAVAILDEELKRSHPFVIHCFSGGPELAARMLDLGAVLSFSGLITFKNADNIRAALRCTPLDRMMFETDSPYLAPEPYRGKRNQPAYVVHVIARAAAELGQDPDELTARCTATACRFFGLV